jgi:AbrB family looped-hinge helix DNA binding protein
MDTVRMSSKGQVVIPKKIRESLKLAPGDRLEVSVEEGGVMLRAKPAPLGELFGCLAGEPLVDVLEREHRLEIEKDARR